ncbi:quinohemoprotein amine dehydrogenase subunit alpha [Rhodovulum tesquicola]|uniref:quinohemoprotein amine dehydrogenase subunit alpha n=1 Tax=Rhodovulum tesquicola TaxID=540254 RepID=UPI00209803CA|nr:quinohemoprotein amine dehydrogenase subunit alpha [Rhodovulum tesquicola]MCO8143672.1 quinohemoprotein amine dehydrogenase subunit alpha [Rhodovulum tesquicola]
MSRTAPALWSTCAALALALPALAMEPQEILDRVCTTCHAPRADGSLPRIDDGRRTPEGWDMTLVRMMRNHGVRLSGEERAAMVRHLADTRGLSVAETEGWRYILEQEPVSVDLAPTQDLAEMCARCHSFARVALQRRTREDWAHMIHFHLGQYPTLEYQALARDRDWWGLAMSEVLDFLAGTYGLGDAPAPVAADLSGAWSVAGRMPGRGDYAGTMHVMAEGAGYEVHLDMGFADGSHAHFDGQGLVYGAGEWRATLSDGETEIRQVMALGADGALSGRWFDAESDVIGARMLAAREDAAPRILGISPGHLRLGEAAEVTLTGVGLSGAPVLPEGVSAELVSESATQVVLRVTAGEEAAVGPVTLGLGDLAAPLVLYDRLDRIAVVPEVTISRVGGNDGPIAKVPAQFEVLGYLNGPDGEPGTEDDILVGHFPADWSTENFDEVAAAMEDARFAGVIDGTGRFTPGDAGPNPERPMMTNNAGNLWVVARLEQAGEVLEGRAQLYATVQRFVDPPIR